MHSTVVYTFLASVFWPSALALPAFKARDLNIIEDVVLFDAPAYQNPSNPEETLASLQSFVFIRQLDLSPLADIVTDGLEQLGLDIGDQIESVLDKLKLFAAIGLGGKEVDITVDGCSTEAVLEETEGLGSDLGIVVNDALSLGTCQDATELVATTEASDIFDTRVFTSRIFPSKPDGFGVISGNQLLVYFIGCRTYHYGRYRRHDQSQQCLGQNSLGESNASHHRIIL